MHKCCFVVFLMPVVLNLTGRVTRRGGGAFIIQSHNHSPLCKSIRKHPSMIAVIRCARVPRVQTLVGSAHRRETLAILTEVRRHSRLNEATQN